MSPPRPTDPPVDEDARYKVIPILTRDFFSVLPHLQAESVKVHRPESDPKRKTRPGVAVKVSGRGFCQVLLYANHSCRKRASACHRDGLRSCQRPDTTAAKLGVERNCRRLLPGQSTVACKGQNRKPRSNRFSRCRRGFPCMKRLRVPDSPIRRRWRHHRAPDAHACRPGLCYRRSAFRSVAGSRTISAPGDFPASISRFATI